MELGYRNIISGLEGCGKSSAMFETLMDSCTVEQPVLFGVKNYTLMEEQIDNWSNKYNIPIEEFAICGYSSFYERAKQAYTNKEIPYLLGKKTRFVFTTQAQIQRNNHKKFKTYEGLNVNWQHIVIDEFDYTNSLIPTLDFYFSRIRDLEEVKDLEQKKYQWILKNYTLDDVANLQLKQKFHNEGFTVAYWVKDCSCAITFLTSEILAKELLLSLPEKELLSERFREIPIESPEFKDCLINTFSYPYVNNHFYEVANREGTFLSLDFDYIISDNILSWYEKKDQINSLYVEKFVPHVGARGSNFYQNHKILTILSHIPNSKLKELYETFKYFDNEKPIEEITRLFYRDRLCQAVGRVLGNRGSKETHLIINSQLKDSIISGDFPYTFNFDWEPDFKNKKEVLCKVENLTLTNNEVRKTNRAAQQIISFSILEDYFDIDFNSCIPVSDIKEYCKKYNLRGLSLKSKNTIPATKLVSYFQNKVSEEDAKNINIKNVRQNSKTVRCLVGLKIIR